jgi:transcriptional regulator with PAS, ATPase and Fis domain
MIRLYATSTSPVLIVGETGTGKELVARTIHELSARQQEVYLPINCGAIPDTLMETELFGSERGAYTDAITRPGVFERANRGSLFLDEVGEMGLQHQVKLLRVIEDKSFTRVGGVHSVSSDARIIAATNRTLSSAVQNGTFRQDLYYRINTLPLSVPPLRRRKMDIPELARNFVRLYTGNGGGHAVISSSAIEKLVEYRWPGNIRELKNVIERALLFAENGRIDTRHVTFG